MKYILLVALCLSLALIGQAAFAQYPGFDVPGSKASGGAAGLVPVEPRIDGGSVPNGATSQVVVLFRNDGARPVETGKINLYPSSNVSAHVSMDQCAGEALVAGAECAVAVSVKGLQAGPWRLEMLMLHSGRSRLVTATLAGIVDSGGDSTDRLASDVELVPDQLDFGSLASGQTIVEPVVLRNITSNAIKITDIAVNSSAGSGFMVESECDELQAGQVCLATVSWAPRQKGPSTGVLVVKHNGPTAVASVPLSGDYAPDEAEEANVFPEAVPGRGLLVSSQSEVEFGDAVSSASTITVSLVNTGDAPITFKEIKLSGSDNGLSLSANGCAEGVVLEPVEACPLTLTWSPTRIGTLLDDVQVLHDGARGVLVLPVRGSAEAAVSQDQKAIVLTKSSAPTQVIGNDGVVSDVENGKLTAKRQTNATNVANASSALDGFKITSFSAKRAIVNGPGGSRLVHDNEEIVLGGLAWDVKIQKNGIEFSSGADRILLLFDRSLSSVNRVSAQSSNRNTSTASASSSE